MITLSTSLLSALLARIKTTKYRRKKQAIVTSTEILPLSARFVNSVKTLSKSIGFGAWMKFPPKDVKWLQRHLRWVVFESWLTFNENKKNSIKRKKWTLSCVLVYSTQGISAFCVRWLPSSKINSKFISKRKRAKARAKSSNSYRVFGILKEYNYFFVSLWNMLKLSFTSTSVNDCFQIKLRHDRN